MIVKIKKIKSWGIFSDWDWPSAGLNSFGRYNVIYGWNGSGKTTLTRLFRTLETKKNLEPFAESTFSFETVNTTFDHTTYANFDQTVKVFNQDFIKENISWDNCEASPILGVGKDAQEYRKKLEESEKKLELLRQEQTQKNGAKKKEANSLEGLLHDKAKGIKEFIGYLNSDGHYNLYDQKKLKQALEVYDESANYALTEDEKDKEYKIVSSKVLNTLEKVTYNFKKDNGDYRLDSSEIKKINDLFEKTVNARTIERLKNNSDVNSWVKQGLELHKQLNSLENCEFCGSKFADEFWQNLEDHFSKEYESFIKDCIDTSKTLQYNKVLLATAFTDNFYDDLKPRAKTALFDCERTKDAFNFAIDSIISELNGRADKPLQKSSFLVNETEILKLYSEMEHAYSTLNEIIEMHNDRTLNFSKSIDSAKKKLELNNISEFYDAYKELKNKISTLENEIGILNKDIVDLDAEVKELKNKSSDYGIKLEEFNNLLLRFLGRSEVKLESLGDEKENRYVIKRHDKIAKHLSEGERTAIAFIYFITKLRELDFDIKNGIIVIDDPVSSLDSNFTFSAFSFMKEQVKEAKQLFIFTHNFNFLKLVIRWFDGKNESVEQKNKDLPPGTPKLPPKAAFYMILNSLDANSRRAAQLGVLDPFLYGYQSEYEFLYKELRRYSVLPTSNLEAFYNAPNMARKLLEIFMQFKHPGKLELKDRLSREKDFDQTEIDRIFNFINFHSHGSAEKGDSVDLTFLGETPIVISQIFKFLSKVDPTHVERMDQLVKKQYPDYFE